MVTEFLAEVVALATCSRSTCAGFPRYFAERGTKQLQNTSQTNYLKTLSNTKAEQHSMLLHFENGPIPKGHMIFLIWIFRHLCEPPRIPEVPD